MKDLFYFEKMITPRLITGLYWAALVITVVVGIIMIIAGLNQPYGGGWTIFTGFLWLVFGPLAIRLYAELMIVIFKINENIGVMKDIASSSVTKATL